MFYLISSSIFPSLYTTSFAIINLVPSRLHHRDFSSSFLNKANWWALRVLSPFLGSKCYFLFKGLNPYHSFRALTISSFGQLTTILVSFNPFFGSLNSFLDTINLLEDLFILLGLLQILPLLKTFILKSSPFLPWLGGVLGLSYVLPSTLRVPLQGYVLLRHVFPICPCGPLS